MRFGTVLMNEATGRQVVEHSIKSSTVRTHKERLRCQLGAHVSLETRFDMNQGRRWPRSANGETERRGDPCASPARE